MMAHRADARLLRMPALNILCEPTARRSVAKLLLPQPPLVIKQVGDGCYGNALSLVPWFHSNFGKN